jgi:hypothetical protein
MPVSPQQGPYGQMPMQMPQVQYPPTYQPQMPIVPQVQKKLTSKKKTLLYVLLALLAITIIATLITGIYYYKTYVM